MVTALLPAGIFIILAMALVAGAYLQHKQNPTLANQLQLAGLVMLATFVVHASLIAGLNLVEQPTLQLVVALVGGVVIVALTEFTRHFLNEPVSSKAQAAKPAGRHDQKVIKHYSQSLSRALDLQRLGDTLLNLMVETLGVDRACVLTAERDQLGRITLSPLAFVGFNTLNPFQFTVDSPFIHYFRTHKQNLTLSELQASSEFKLLSADERRWIEETKIVLFVPILRQQDLLGLLAFGKRSDMASFYEEDLDLMATLADQAALAIDNARLFEQLATINQQVGSLSTQLTHLDQKKSDFLSIASHELRTPLTHIHGYSRILLDLTEEDLKNPEYVKTVINGVVKGSDRLKDIVDVMFDVTEADIGAMSLFTGPVLMSKVIEQASRNLLPAMDERRMAFSVQNVEDLPMIEADGTRLVQAFENLIGNALKYTPDGGTIIIQGAPAFIDDLTPSIEIAVIDTGIGIAKENQERIFEKFFRVGDVHKHSTGKTKFQGAGPGLGLTLVKGIVEAHNGRVWVDSPGHDEQNYPGTTFYIHIPVEAVEEEVPQPSKEVRQSQIETRHWRRRDLEEMRAKVEAGEDF